jgi:hypothetical protein
LSERRAKTCSEYLRGKNTASEGMSGSETTSFPVTDANPHGNKRVEITLANGHDIYV